MSLDELAIALGVVFAVNLLPAFGPPTWAVLVFFSLDFDLPAVPLVLGGALAAASGRYVLANGARLLRPRLSAARLERLDRAEAAMRADRGLLRRPPRLLLDLRQRRLAGREEPRRRRPRRAHLAAGNGPAAGDADRARGPSRRLQAGGEAAGKAVGFPG